MQERLECKSEKYRLNLFFTVLLIKHNEWHSLSVFRWKKKIETDSYFYRYGVKTISFQTVF